VLFRDSVLSSVLRLRWLRWLGSIAFGVYLFHELIRSLFFGLIWSHLPSRMSLAEICVSSVALAVTLGLCYLSWKFFEKPLIDIGHRQHYERFGRRREEVLVAEGAKSGEEVAV